MRPKGKNKEENLLNIRRLGRQEFVEEEGLRKGRRKLIFSWGNVSSS